MSGRLTPEGKVKAVVVRMLTKYAPKVTYRSDVRNGMGRPDLDFTVCANGHYFKIECKADMLKLTKRQELTVKEFEAAGAEVFTVRAVDDMKGLLRLRQWLKWAVENPA